MEMLARFRGCPMLVVGDCMLDECLWGQVTRISPEAPVPVVAVQRRTFLAGGAANTAANVAALGGVPILAGVVGDDEGAGQLRRVLADVHVAATAVVTDATRPTTTKTRVLAQHQQMLRIDTEQTQPIARTVQDELLASIASILPGVRGCILSDYGKGVATPDFCAALMGLCHSAGVPVIVDPKGTDYAKYRGARVVKPNQLEAANVLNRELRNEDAVRAAGRELIERLGGSTAILITQGAAGMSLFERGRPVVQVPALAREVFDVTGAGDTVASALGLTLAAGGSLEVGCRIASAAAAVVVGKVGTAMVTLDELLTAWDRSTGRLAA
ncbi:MAG: D-glycero-beta-D-manno-heptose-7-phosphate kinase [Gemmataceae bacterium]